MAVLASLPKGTRDFLPATLNRRDHVVETIRKVYRRYGFDPLETPAIENIDTLTGKYGEEGDQLLFKILKRGAKAARGECDLGLRYDLTVPLARVVAMHRNELPRVFKRYQIQPVWRADRPARGRFREFFQCDIDIVGAVAPVPEIELLSALQEAFAALGFDDITVRLNDRRVLRGLVESVGIPSALETEAIIAIDKLDKIGADGVRAELAERGIDAASAAGLLALLAEIQVAESPLERLRAVFAPESEGAEGVETLAVITQSLAQLGLADGRVLIDATLARGLGYYTGPIFEVGVADLAGSLAGGGRYDGLIGMFSGQDIPACGVSLGLERILVVMEERGMLPSLDSCADVFVAYFSSSTVDASLRAARDLRRLGLNVDVFPQKSKLAKQFKEAHGRGIPFVLVVGPDEASADVVKLKDMESGEQSVVRTAEVAAIVHRAKAARGLVAATGASDDHGAR